MSDWALCCEYTSGEIIYMPPPTPRIVRDNFLPVNESTPKTTTTTTTTARAVNLTVIVKGAAGQSIICIQDKNMTELVCNQNNKDDKTDFRFRHVPIADSDRFFVCECGIYDVNHNVCVKTLNRLGSYIERVDMSKAQQ